MQPPLTTAQAAEQLGLSARTVQVYCQAGKIRATRHGKKDFLILVSDLEAFEKIPRKVGRPKKPNP